MDNLERNKSINIKKPISDTFYPNPETIELARSRGLYRVTDTNEIQAFITYNKEYEILWADFNPTFLHWLELTRPDQPIDTDD